MTAPGRRSQRRVLVACLLHLARVRARDDVVTMFCKRVGALHNKARQQLEALRDRHRADSERLIGVFADVLGVVRTALDDEHGVPVDSNQRVEARRRDARLVRLRVEQS